MCLHNLRLVAKYHGFDLEVFRDKIGPTAESQAFLDGFDMGNDVDHRDASSVALEREIADAHEDIDMRLLVAVNADNVHES
jgi:hypothetical protein